MNLKLSTTKAIALAAGVLAGAALSASGAQAGMRIHFGFPLGSFHTGGGHHQAHNYHAGRLHALRRAREIEAARARKAAAAAARYEQKRAALAAAAAAKRKAAAERAIAEQKKLEAAKEAELATIPEPVKKPDVKGNGPGAAPLKTAAVTAAADPAPADEEPANLECKRYFANVGMTITVPCTE